MAYIGVLVLVWVVSGVLAYFATEGVVLHSDRQVWNRTTRKFTVACGVLLGPLYLLISAELLLLTLMGEGLAQGKSRHYRNS